jgi:hypothetical protein
MRTNLSTHCFGMHALHTDFMRTDLSMHRFGIQLKFDKNESQNGLQNIGY